MSSIDERREENRQRIDSPAYLCWQGERGAVEVKAKAFNLNGSGVAVRLHSPLQEGQILWCAVPSFGIYARARVAHTSGLLFRSAGLEFLASGWATD